MTASTASRALRAYERFVDRNSVRASCWVSVLPPSTVPDERTLRTPVEPMILDRDEGVLEMDRDVRQRHVLVVLVHPEPLPAVGRQEPGVPHAAGEPVHGVPLPE
jgi:hypothetical protein